MPKTEAELLQEFEELVADMRGLANGLLKPKNPANLQYIEQRFYHLTKLVRKNPEHAEAVLLCANAMWYLLYDTAHTGVSVQHRRDGLPDAAPEDEVLQLWNEIHKQNPDIGKSKAVDEIMEALECSERTVWNRLKKIGI